MNRVVACEMRFSNQQNISFSMPHIKHDFDPKNAREIRPTHTTHTWHIHNWNNALHSPSDKK